MLQRSAITVASQASSAQRRHLTIHPQRPPHKATRYRIQRVHSWSCASSRGWKPLISNVTSEGPPTAPTFACWVRLALPDQVLEAAAPSASTKNEAAAIAGVAEPHRDASRVGPEGPMGKARIRGAADRLHPATVRGGDLGPRTSGRQFQRGRRDEAGSPHQGRSSGVERAAIVQRVLQERMPLIGDRGPMLRGCLLTRNSLSGPHRARRRLASRNAARNAGAAITQPATR